MLSSVVQEGQMDLGSTGEAVAARFLRDKGHRILLTNYRCRIGEIDIVSTDGAVIVFCEVKTRASDAKGQPFESVTRRKQQTLRRCAEHFLLAEYHELRTCRFDVVSIKWPPHGPPTITHLENAFQG